MFGLRRKKKVGDTTYYLCQLPCSDEIEVEHPPNANYVVAWDANSRHFKHFDEADKFFTAQTGEQKFDPLKHHLKDGTLTIK